jgi:hypothetical protein
MQSERGGSLLQTLFNLVVLAYVVLLGMRVAPALIEYSAVSKAVARAATLSSEEQARQVFDAEATLRGVSSVRGSDLRIESTGDSTLRISYAYEREFALMGPAYLTLRFRGQSF